MSNTAINLQEFVKTNPSIDTGELVIVEVETKYPLTPRGEELYTPLAGSVFSIEELLSNKDVTTIPNACLVNGKIYLGLELYQDLETEEITSDSILSLSPLSDQLREVFDTLEKGV